MTEKLYCENGQHFWERESKRGKKPKNCPSHAPAPAPKSAAELNEAGERKLVCEHDGHEWWAPVQRGRPPRFCSEHRPEKPIYKPKPKGKHVDHSSGIPTKMSPLKPSIVSKSTVLNENGYQDLICEFDGHHWIAETKRGRPPKFCPEHRPSTSSTAVDRFGVPIGKRIGEYEGGETGDQWPNTETSTRELYCHAGDHTWQAERKRGKPPRNCPEHAVTGAIERKVELTQEKKEKAQKALQDEIARLSARVEDAEILDRDAMSELQAAGGVDEADEEFKIWLRANTALLHEVESLRARERKLVEL